MDFKTAPLMVQCNNKSLLDRQCPLVGQCMYFDEGQWQKPAGKPNKHDVLLTPLMPIKTPLSTTFDSMLKAQIKCTKDDVIFMS